MDRKDSSQPDQALPDQPPGGGSFQANPDGSLERLAGTEPAEPKLGPEPQPRD